MVTSAGKPLPSGTTISTRALNRAFLARQMLLARHSVSALDAIERLVGLQAQVARPPFIGLWTRLRDFDRSELATALHERRAVRVTAMRGTLHVDDDRGLRRDAWRHAADAHARHAGDPARPCRVAGDGRPRGRGAEVFRRVGRDVRRAARSPHGEVSRRR